jgi:hypothetical protein
MLNFPLYRKTFMEKARPDHLIDNLKPRYMKIKRARREPVEMDIIQSGQGIHSVRSPEKLPSAGFGKHREPAFGTDILRVVSETHGQEPPGRGGHPC